MRYILVIAFLLSNFIVLAQNNETPVIRELNDFYYTRTDTAICNNLIKRINFINDIDTTEFYNEYNYIYPNNKLLSIETGYSKKGIAFGKLNIFDTLGNITYEIDYDTLLVGYQEIIKIAKDYSFDIDTITVYYLHKTEINLPFEGYWIIHVKTIPSTNEHFTETENLLINAMTGALEMCETSISEQPSYIKEEYIDPLFISGNQGLKEFLNEKSNYPIIKNGKNWVDVSFDILESGKVQNISINCTNSTYYNNEAIRLVQLMPNWKPATDLAGNKTNINWNIRINFK